MIRRRDAVCFQLAVAVLLCLVLAACGGGNGDPKAPPPPPTITGVSVSCGSASVFTGQTLQCAATVTGTGNYSSAVTWSASAGTISSAGLFTAPASAGTVTVTATSTADPTKSGSATITVSAALPAAITSVSANCASSSVVAGQTLQCTATVSGTGTYSMTVTWSASAGAISSGGLFSAPAAVGQVTITATSLADTSKSGSTSVTVTAAAPKAAFDYKGVTHVSWWTGDYSSAAGAASQDAIATTGSTWAGLLVTQYMASKTSTTIVPTAQTPTDADLVAAINELHGKGLKVMLKPHVDVSDGSWRGQIIPTDVAAWFQSFTTFITHYAQLAQSDGVEMLCFGTEYATMTGSANRTAWHNVIAGIRAVYDGELAYAANATYAGDEFTSVSFWDEVDVIGLDAYFPLTNQSDPTVTQLVAAWSRNKNGENIVQDVVNFASAHPDKPVIFTEIGYRSVAGANIAPWDYSSGGTVDNAEQQNCYEAMYEVWGQRTATLKGNFWWDWPVSPPAANDTDYNPRNKPAAVIMQNWLLP